MKNGNGANNELRLTKGDPKSYTQKKALLVNNEYYRLRSILGNDRWCRWYVLMGGRMAGKSFSVMDLFLSDWSKKEIPFTWIRLKESVVKKLLANNAADLIDPIMRDRYNLDLKVKGNVVYDKGKPMCRVLALSTFHNDKGVQTFDPRLERYNMCMDEMNKEKNEKSFGDIIYAFVNQVENNYRNAPPEKCRFFLVGNTLEEASDIMVAFDFLPEKWGRYKIRKRHAVIDFIPPSDKYFENRKDAASNDFAIGGASTFSNQITISTELLRQKRLVKPLYQIWFSDSDDEKFTVWDDGIIAQAKGEKVRVIPMRPHLDKVFIKDKRDAVIKVYHNRGFGYTNLITQKKFKKYMELLKPNG